MVGLLQIKLLQKRLAQGIERLKDGVAHEIARLRIQIGVLARIKRLQSTTHIVQRRVRV